MLRTRNNPIVHKIEEFFKKVEKKDDMNAKIKERGPAHPARPHGAECYNCVPTCPHLEPSGQAWRAKLSHYSAVSGWGRLGPDAPMPPAPRGPAIGRCRNSGFF